jgi:hydrogenase-4 component B
MMRLPMIVLALACLAIGLAPIVFWPAVARAAACWNPAWRDLAAPVSLGTIGTLHVALAVLAAGAVALLWRRLRQTGLRRAVTWDCGYAAPTARMQYTAGSFAGIITEWFGWILRPQRHAEPIEQNFPARASHDVHTPETVLEHVIAPVADVVMRLSTAARRLQHGRVQAYVFYVVAGVAALAVVALKGGAP